MQVDYNGTCTGAVGLWCLHVLQLVCALGSCALLTESLRLMLTTITIVTIVEIITTIVEIITTTILVIILIVMMYRRSS